MGTSWELGFVYAECCKVRQFNAEINVKGERYILSTLKHIIPFTRILGSRYEKIKKVSDEIEQCIKELDVKYGLKSKEKTKMYITSDDAMKLEKQSLTWYQTIGNAFTKSSIKLIDLDKLNIEAIELSKMVGPDAAKDIDDAYNCIGNGLPTPAVMIMYRVGEHMVKKLYKEIMKKDPSKYSNWGKLETALREKSDEGDPLIGLLQFMRSKRNAALHPGERYTQKESEHIFLQIRELIVEIDCRLKK